MYVIQSGDSSMFVCTPFWYGQISSKGPEFCLYLIDSAIKQIWKSDLINKQIIETERNIVLSLIPTQMCQKTKGVSLRTRATHYKLFPADPL